MSAEVDALLQIAALALGIAAGYAGYSYRARPVLDAVARLVALVQQVRGARADGTITDAERLAIADETIALERAIGQCSVLLRR